MPIIVSADHIAKAQGAFEPQRVNNFTVVLNPPAGVDWTIIQKAIEAFPIADEKNDPIKVPFGNEERKVAGRATYGSIAFTVRDYADQPVGKNLLAWRKKVYDPATGKIGLAKDYKSDGVLILGDPQGGNERQYKLMGLWPSSHKLGSYDMKGTDQAMIDVTFEVDKMTPSTGIA